MRHILDSKELIIFDLDGTLIDSVNDLAQGVNRTLAELGYPERNLEYIRAAIGNGAKVLVEKCLPQESDWTEEVQAVFMKHYLNCCSLESKLYPQVLEILETFKNKKLALLTNKPIEPTKILLKQFDIGKYFSAVVGGDTYPTRKPDPAGMLNILKDLNVKAENAVMVGDGIPDMQAALAAKVECIAILEGIGTAEELLALKPDHTVTEIGEILK